MEVKCNICGTMNEEGAVFCKDCFQKLDTLIKPIVEEVKVVGELQEEEEKEPWNNEDVVENMTPIDDVINSEIEKLKDEEITKNEEKEDFSYELKPIIEEKNLENEIVRVTTKMNGKPINALDDNLIIDNPNITLDEDNKEENNEIDSWDDSMEILNDDTSSWNERIEQDVIEPIAELTEIPDNQAIIQSNNDDWNDDWNNMAEEKEKSKDKTNYILRFVVIYLISSFILFGIAIIGSKYLTNVVDEATSELIEFAIYRIVGLATLMMSAKITYRKGAPTIPNFNKVTFITLFLVAFPSMFIQMIVLGFIKDTKVLMFIIGIMLSLITLVLFFDYSRKTIKKINKDLREDKVTYIYGVINIVLIVGLMFFGMEARKQDMDMPKINFLYSLFESKEKNEEIIEKFINQIELTIIKNQTEIENFELPLIINDTNYAKYDELVPDSMEINLNENGAIINGTIVYRGITYKYDGEKVKAE